MTQVTEPWTSCKFTDSVDGSTHWNVWGPDGRPIAQWMSEENANRVAHMHNTHAQLVEALESAQAVIRKLASEGRYFDNLDRTMGLEGFINHALASAKGGA